MHWSIRECTLASGREIEIVNVPGHCDYISNTYVVCIPRVWASCVCVYKCVRARVCACAGAREKTPLITRIMAYVQGAALADMAMLVVAARMGEFEAGIKGGKALCAMPASLCVCRLSAG
jgi:hypothetical protein